MMSELKNILKDFPFKCISSTRSLLPESALMIFCDPRGGSTWLAESLNTISKSLIIDEPLHLNNTKVFKELKFGWRQNIPEDADWPEAKNAFDKILSGQLLNSGICYRNSYKDALLANQLILKIIRGKALLPWLTKQFDFKYKPIFMVRNPFAVAASQLEHGAWNYSFEPFKIPDSPFNEYYKKHQDYLSVLTTKEEQLTALWCLANNSALKHPANNKNWISINYENLVLEPEKEFKKIFEAWNIAMPSTLLDKLNQPSSTTVGKNVINRKDLIHNWKNKLSQKQVDQLQNVLSHFDIDYYSTDPMPLIPANRIHLKK